MDRPDSERLVALAATVSGCVGFACGAVCGSSYANVTIFAVIGFVAGRAFVVGVAALSWSLFAESPANPDGEYADYRDPPG
jgi:hypothetical protein